MDVSSGEPSRKRRRSNDSQTNMRYLQRSLVASISPPPLQRTKLEETPKFISSPFQLTSIRDLPASSNVDAVSLKDLLCDPMISECWEFNYLHDIDFLMSAFDEDVREIVKVHVIHGFWKKEDTSRINLMAQAEKYSNVTLHAAYMPEMFGTHHTKVETLLYERLFSNIQKMLILIRHDSTAQVIIHTANMIAFDWTNMTQAVWKSPHLPLLNKDSVTETSKLIGSGSKFKTDLLNYLRTYDLKRQICKPLIEQLSQHDFSEVRAALIASVPGKQDLDTGIETLWGWPGLRNALKSVPGQNREPEIVVQISSIASIGQSNKWLDQTMFKTLGASKGSILSKPDFRIIFPTADEVRRSLNGYRSGSAIHTKIQTAAQSKQLQYLKPFLNHWAGDGAQHSLNAPKSTSDAGRKRAAPHIKTYIRFSDSNKAQIDWMLVTSANLSKQAWGEASNAAGEVRICSYEVGVLVWPGLFGEKATMVPTFRSDAPKAEQNSGEVIVAARMPYDLPLTPYAKDDVPWCATASYTEPDWMGETYNVG